MSTLTYVEAPSRSYHAPGAVQLFLAGGITGCPDWQRKVVATLRCECEAAGSMLPDVVVFNPRRADFDVTDPRASQVQIRWEYDMLGDADIRLFWFCAATLCPIVLYELGLWCNARTEPCVVGVEPGYAREQDVHVQTSIARPGINVVDSLENAVEELLFQLEGM